MKEKHPVCQKENPFSAVCHQTLAQPINFTF
jgi:hypothetical protein